MFVFALVCKGWRKAQLKVGGPLRTRVKSDVILQGRAELAKWALAEGCPRVDEDGFPTVADNTLATAAATYGHLELLKWLCSEGGFAMDDKVMRWAAYGGKLEVVQWLRGNGCPWHISTCTYAMMRGPIEVLRWLRENGCWWKSYVRRRALCIFRYTDNLGNESRMPNYVDHHPDVVAYYGRPMSDLDDQ